LSKEVVSMTFKGGTWREQTDWHNLVWLLHGEQSGGCAG
jgi:hypothetical protein